MNLLEKLKIKLGIISNDDNDLLNLLLDDSRDYILAYTGRNIEQWLSIFDSIQIKIAIFEYQRLGNENIKIQSVGSVSNSYIEAYPEDIINALKGYRLIKVGF